MEEENTVIENEELVDGTTLPGSDSAEIPTQNVETPEENENLEAMPEPEPTEEQIAFKEVLASMEKMGLSIGDTVCFRNGEIGRIDNFYIDEQEMMYRIYIKITDTVMITLNEELKNTDGNINYEATKILSKDFTSVKIEKELSELVLTKEQAQEELTTLKGQTVVIE